MSNPDSTYQTRRKWLASLTPEERHQAAIMCGDLMAKREIRGELIRMALVAAAMILALGGIAWLT